jgi:hypothetical protein
MVSYETHLNVRATLLPDEGQETGIRPGIVCYGSPDTHA